MGYSMKGRVDYRGAIALNWTELVSEPQKLGYYVEAFGNADALLDSAIFTLFQKVQDDFEYWDLIRELYNARKLTSMMMLKILNLKNIVPKKFMTRLKEFKKARNKVVHSYYGEHSLIMGELGKYTDQENWDSAASEKANKILNDALNLHEEIYNIIVKISKGIRKY